MYMNDINKEFYKKLGISDKAYDIGQRALERIKDQFALIDANAEINQMKVLSAFQKHRVSESCFMPTSGYGYGDVGRDILEEVYATCFHGESALVRPQMISGTHAITTAFFGNLRPGDEILSPVGKPYDTLDKVIGIVPASGSLAEFDITYKQVDLLEDGSFDYEKIKNAITEKTRLVTIQRSKGYVTRKTFSCEEVRELARFIKDIKSDVIIMVDNCYCEFVGVEEPLDYGADIIVGSLIKNPGGGLSPIGGYIVGKEEYVENAAYRLSSPGLGKEVGSSLGVIKSMYQGLFMAPTVVASALKGAIFASAIYEDEGFKVAPKFDEPRYDIIQTITFGEPAAVCRFCEGIQAAAPIDSFVRPEPSDMPGYISQVIMAAGTFVSGASIELSADAPMREPYTVFYQGGLTWAHAKFGILLTLQKLIDASMVDT